MISRPPAAVTEILFEALDRDGEARRTYLDQACGQDQELRGEVESLLSVSEADGLSRFLAAPALEVASPETPVTETDGGDQPNLEIPDQIGPFRIVERLGKGGMGAVYLARQDEPIERQVAIKVVHALHHSRWRQRFTAECQALARLNHPHIAALYEVGSTESLSGEGVPFVAMELIDGEPVTAWCDREKANLERRIQIFLDICSGISHAHRHGILHCDLKPANVLVTRAEGRAKVIDFGIARAVDDLPAAETVTQDLIFGSPPYISPEMMMEGGKALDTRTDVYALGLILYELLVGTLPFRASSTWLLMLQIAEKDLESPAARFSGLTVEEQEAIAAARETDSRSLARSCRGDLEAIALKAIDRDPEQRYGSPAELAADLRRFLAGEPIQARVPGSWEQLGRFLRRHKELAIGLLAVFLALSAGFVARTVEARRANAEAQRANAEAQRAQTALTESEQIREFLIDLFEGANPEENAGETVTVRELLEQGSERLRTELVEQPLVRASLLQTVGSIQVVLGDFGDAEELLLEALEIRSERLPEEDPLVVESEAGLGVALYELGRMKEAEALLARAVAAGRVAPDVDRKLLARAYNDLGRSYWRQGRFDEAETELRAGLALAQELGDPLSVARTGTSLGIVLHGRSRFSEARELLVQALEIYRTELDPKHPTFAAQLNSVGMNARLQPSWKDAESYFRQAIEVFQEIYDPDHFRVLRSRRNLAEELTRRHRWNQAVQEAEDVLRLSEESGLPQSVASARNTLGQVEIRAGLVPRAVETLRRCVREAEAAFGSGHDSVLTCQLSLSRALVKVGEIEAGLLIQRDLAQIFERRNNLRRLRWIQIATGQDLLSGRRFLEAERTFRSYLEGLEEGMPQHVPHQAQVLLGLGQALAGQGRLDEAAEALGRGLELVVDFYGLEHPDIAEIAHELGLIETQRGRRSQARELLQQALTIRSALFPEGDADTKASREALSSLGADL